jgi:malate dehydrogenase (oxaloacetate-decarboxylating)(NADP+)
MSDNLRDAALDHHRDPTPGKIAVIPTQAMAAQRAHARTRRSA